MHNSETKGSFSANKNFPTIQSKQEKRIIIIRKIMKHFLTLYSMGYVKLICTYL